MRPTELPDQGRIRLGDDEDYAVDSTSCDEDGLIWHQIDPAIDSAGWVGRKAILAVDTNRRLTLSRYHTVLHILNTIALRKYGSWMTGAQIGMDHSRIDFKSDRFSREVADSLELEVNKVIGDHRRIRAYYLQELEFNGRNDLLRTLEARPPVAEGRVRIVEIEGFDAQACGGTHVANTNELGSISIFRMENKGAINKRLYVRLDEAGRPQGG